MNPAELSSHSWAALLLGGLALIAVLRAPHVTLRIVRGALSIAFFTVLFIVLAPLGVVFVILERAGIVAEPVARPTGSVFAGATGNVTLPREAAEMMPVLLLEWAAILNVRNRSDGEDGVKRSPFE